MTKPLVQDLILPNAFGFHTRTAARFAKVASNYQSDVLIRKGNETVDGKSILDLLTLAAGQGTKIALEVSGVDQDSAFAELKALVEDGFGEK